MAFKKQRLLTTASALAIGLGLNTGARAADLGEVMVAPAAPVVQGRTISGLMALYGGGYRINDEDGVFSGFLDSWAIVGGDARVDIPFSETFSLQLDLEGESGFDNTGSEADDHLGKVAAAGHLNYRQLDRYLFGAFGGGGMIFQGSDHASSQHRFLGVEGQWYFGHATLYGQVGWMDSSGDGEFDALNDAWFVRGVGRTFFNGGNTKLEGEVSYANGEQDPTDDVSVIGWGAEIEHVLRSFGSDGFLSGFARYEGVHFDKEPADRKTTNHIFMVGIKMDMNQLNPLSRDRTGATLDLPDFAAWNAAGNVTD